MKVLVPMRQALADKAVLGAALPGDSWRAWRILLIAAAGEPLLDDERETFTRLTGREREPLAMVLTLLVVAGRRSGKTRAMSVFCTWLATCIDWSDCLSLGERAVCLFLSPVERQAAIAHAYAEALIDNVDLFKAQVVSRTASAIELHNRIDLRTEAANWRHNRGSTCIAICLDELAFFRSGDVANSDIEIVQALKPSLASTGGPLLLTSSPAAMEGIVFRLWKRHYGAQGDLRVLVVQAETRALNPSLRQDVVDRAYEEDPIGAEAEYGAVFRQPVSAYLARSVVEAAIDRGVEARAALPGVTYHCFVDVSGGGGGDSFCVAIGHMAVDRERGEVCVIDALGETVSPFNPFDAVAAAAKMMRDYGINFCHGDSYAGDWPLSAFGRVGISYMKAPLTTSENYLHSMPLWTSSHVVMLDVPRAVDQICNLQRKLQPGGRETVTHPRGAHDDLACVIAGLLWKLTPAQADFVRPEFYGALAAANAHWGVASASAAPGGHGHHDHHADNSDLVREGVEPWRQSYGAPWKRFDHLGF